MKYSWIDEYLRGKRGVTKDLQAEWNWERYLIDGKMFAAVCLDPDDKPYYITMKLDPVEGDYLRQQYPDIVPGYYMNKQHWNSVKPDGEVSDDLMKHMLDEAYRLILSSFSGKKQREILGLTVCGSDCTKCGCYGNMCTGCNESNGKVFHAPKNAACPIYRCAVNQNKYANCAGCDKLPCDVWRATKDPSMTEEAFEASISQRVENLSPGKKKADAV